MSFQSGYRYPSIFEAYPNVNSGGVRKGRRPARHVAGRFLECLAAIFHHRFPAGRIKRREYQRLKPTGGHRRRRNKSLLKKNPYTYIKPEHDEFNRSRVQGRIYRRKGCLRRRSDLYFNNYRNFIAQANMNAPSTQSA